MNADRFEGRCTACGGALKLSVQPLSSYAYSKRLSVSEQTAGLILRVDECPDHPGDAGILWPQREDLRRYCHLHEGHGSSGSCSCTNVHNSEI